MQNEGVCLWGKDRNKEWKQRMDIDLFTNPFIHLRESFHRPVIIVIVVEKCVMD